MLQNSEDEDDDLEQLVDGEWCFMSLSQHCCFSHSDVHKDVHVCVYIAVYKNVHTCMYVQSCVKKYMYGAMHIMYICVCVCVWVGGLGGLGGWVVGGEWCVCV